MPTLPNDSIQSTPATATATNNHLANFDKAFSGVGLSSPDEYFLCLDVQGDYSITEFCSAAISCSELYFRIESRDYILGETAYRAACLWATLLLMSGFVCLRKSKPELQIVFTASYVLLNVLY